MILVINQLPLTPFPHCRSRPHFPSTGKANAGLRGQGGGGRACLERERGQQGRREVSRQGPDQWSHQSLDSLGGTSLVAKTSGG